MPRRTKNWIETYVDRVSTLSESPESYHWWSAATIVGAAMKRHTWVPRGTWRLYPNIYTVLIGPPGIGKGSALNPAVDLLKITKAANVMSGRLTIEYVIERLGKGFGSPVPNGNGGMTIGTEASLIIFSPEFDVFVTASQHTFGILTDIWDSKEGDWEYGTRHHGQFYIHDPCLSLLAGCTSDKLMELLPSITIGAGFTRRVNFVYAKDNAQLIPWPQDTTFNDPDLVHDLRCISLLQGQFSWEVKGRLKPSEALFKEFNDYYQKTRRSQDFMDEATASYNSSRYVHAIKLCMAISASKRDDLVITLDDWHEATDRIDRCSEDLKSVFRGVGESDLASVTNRVIQFLAVNGRSTRQQILSVNWNHMSGPTLDIVLSTLISAGLVIEINQGPKTFYQLLTVP